jgi:uncharacterized membrane protein
MADVNTHSQKHPSWWGTRGFWAALSLTVMTLAAAGLRLINLGRKSLWHDEAVTFWISQSSLTTILAENARVNSAPPLYVIIIHFVSGLGHSEAILRSVSCLAGTLAVPVIFWLARRYVGVASALLVAGVVALIPAQVEYSQELREYSLAFLVAILMIGSLYLFVERRGEGATWLLPGSVFLIGTITQYGLALLALSLNIVFLTSLLSIPSRARARYVLRWALGQILFLVGVSFVFLISLRHQFVAGGFGSAYLERGYWNGVVADLPRFAFGQTYELVLFAFSDPPLFVLITLAGFIALWFSDMPLWKKALLIMPFPVAFGFALPRLYPYVGARQAIYLTGPLYVTAGIGFGLLVTHNKSGWILPTILALMLARSALIPTLDYLRSDGFQNVRPVVAWLKDHLQEGDRVYICSGAVPAFRYYYGDDTESVTYGLPGESYRQQLGTLLSDEGRLWLLLSSCGDEATYVTFVSERGPIEPAAKANQVSLYLVR